MKKQGVDQYEYYDLILQKGNKLINITFKYNLVHPHKKLSAGISSATITLISFLISIHKETIQE